MKDIKNITVAIDFSVTARNAYCYARSLANTIHATLTVVHVKEHLMMISDVMIAPFTLIDDKELMNDMEALITEENANTDKSIEQQKVRIKIFSGDPVNVLTELSAKDDTDLIVIGTTGLADILTKIIGSVSLQVSHQAHCPVILVPRNVKWQSIDQILFASNYDSMTSTLVKRITDFALHTHSDMHFVNVKNFDPVFESKQIDIDWNKLIMSANPNLYFEKHTIYGNDTIEQLKKYGAEKNIDLMVFVSKHRNFWESLVHKSITEHMALSTTIPIMVMHLNDENA